MLSELDEWLESKPTSPPPLKKKPVKKIAPPSEPLDYAPDVPIKERKIKTASGQSFDLDKLIDQEQGIDAQEVAERTQIAEMIAKEEKAKQEKLITAVKRGQLIKRELFTDAMMPFVDHLLSDVKRMASTFLTDVGKMIVEAGEVTPEIRAKFEDGVNERMDGAKKAQMKILKEISKKQAEK